MLEVEVEVEGSGASVSRVERRQRCGPSTAAHNDGLGLCCFLWMGALDAAPAAVQ